MLGTACSEQGQDPQTLEKDGISRSADKVTGSYLADGHLVTFTSTATTELRYVVEVQVDNYKLTATINYGNEALTLNGQNAVLSEAQKLAILETGKFFAEPLMEQPAESFQFTDHSLLSMLEYWGKSPKNYAYDYRKVEGKKGAGINSRDEGITCIRKNTYVTAEYDDRTGQHYDRVLVGSKAKTNYGCMGRCGADCGRWWVASAWTKDCLDHDQCSAVNNASGGSSDPNCGDEFDEAADDYVFGVIRGCRG